MPTSIKGEGREENGKREGRDGKGEEKGSGGKEGRERADPRPGLGKCKGGIQDIQTDGHKPCSAY